MTLLGRGTLQMRLDPWGYKTEWLVRCGYGGYYAHHFAKPDYAHGPFWEWERVFEYIEEWYGYRKNEAARAEAAKVPADPPARFVRLVPRDPADFDDEFERLAKEIGDTLQARHKIAFVPLETPPEMQAIADEINRIMTYYEDPRPSLHGVLKSLEARDIVMGSIL